MWWCDYCKFSQNYADRDDHTKYKTKCNHPECNGLDIEEVRVCPVLINWSSWSGYSQEGRCRADEECN